MGRRIDPLELLGKLVNKETETKLVKYLDTDGKVLPNIKDSTHIQLNDWIFSRDAPTRFLSKRGTGAPYSLDAVCFLIVDHPDSSYTEYVQDSRRVGVSVVSLVDKKDLLAHVLERQSSPCVDEKVELPVAYQDWQELSQPTMDGIVASGSVAKDAESAGLFPGVDSAASAKPRSTRPIRTRDGIFSSSKSFAWVVANVKDVLSTTKPTDPLTKSASSARPAVPFPQDKSDKNLSLIDQITKANKPDTYLASRANQKGRESGSHPSIPAGVPGKKSIQLPIIIVPAAPSAMLNLYNAKDFFATGKYVPVADAKAAAAQSNGGKETRVIIEHTMSNTSLAPKMMSSLMASKGAADGRNTMMFQVIDNPTRLDSLDDWNRVVAVIVHGATWQFKGWKWQSPVEIFQHVCGFFLHYDDVKVDPLVAGWNVHQLTISRTKRHLDSTAVFQFWQHLEDFMQSSRPDLLK